MSVPDFTFRQKIEYWFLFWLNRLLPRLSHRERRQLAKIIGLICAHIFPYRKRIIAGNLSRAFPDQSAGWHRSVIRRVYVHLATVYFDIFAGYQLRNDRFFPMIERVEATALEKALRRKRGVVIILFHLGNWELIADWLARRGYQIAAVAARLKNPLADRLVTEIRTRSGGKIFPKGRRYTLPTMRFIRADRLLYLIADQNAGRKGEWVKFFNQWTSSFRGPILFALRKNCPVLLGSCLLDERGRYQIRFEEFNPETSAATSEDSRINGLIQAYTRYFEDLIRLHPEQYYWIHRRWKTRPPRALIEKDHRT